MWLWLVPALLVPFIAALIYFVVLAGTQFAFVVYTLAKVFTLVWPLGVYLFVERGRMRLGGFALKKHLRSLPLGLLTGGFIFVAIFAIYLWTPLGDYVRQYSDIIRQKTDDLGVLGFYIPFVIFLSVVHSLIEEYYWRWFVYGRLRQLCSPRMAGFISSFAFCGHHYVVLGSYFSFWGAALFGSMVGVGGAVWCWQYQKHQSLAGSWLSHCLVDVVIMTIGYFLIFGGA